jgi:hypothetical protein
MVDVNEHPGRQIRRAALVHRETTQVEQLARAVRERLIDMHSNVFGGRRSHQQTERGLRIER